MNALRDRVDLIAAEVGRLRRHVEPGSSLVHVVARLSDHVEALDCLTHPSAGELARDFFCVSGDHDLAIDEALIVVDARARALRRLLAAEAA